MIMKIYDILDDVRYIRYGEQYKSQVAPFSVLRSNTPPEILPLLASNPKTCVRRFS